MKEVYITHGKRTTVGSFLGSLSEMSAPLIGVEVIKAILVESKLDPKLFDEIILGQVIAGGSGQNPARQSLIHAGMPIELPATTINKVCGSGLKMYDGLTDTFSGQMMGITAENISAKI